MACYSVEMKQHAKYGRSKVIFSTNIVQTRTGTHAGQTALCGPVMYANNIIRFISNHAIFSNLRAKYKRRILRVYVKLCVYAVKVEHFNYEGAFSARRSPERVGHRTIRLLVLFSCTCRVYSARLDP